LLQFLINVANRLADAADTSGLLRFFGCFGWLGAGTGLVQTGAAAAAGAFSLGIFFVLGEVSFLASSGTAGGGFCTTGRQS